MAKKTVEKKEIVNLGYGTGRRKTSVARVYLREGNGNIIVNGKAIDEYFVDAISVFTVKQPLVVTETEGPPRRRLHDPRPQDGREEEVRQARSTPPLPVLQEVVLQLLGMPGPSRKGRSWCI